jgi:hypothetical protein
MSEQNTNVAATETTKTKAKAINRGPFATEAEATASKPADEKGRMRLWKVTDPTGGKTVWVWHAHNGSAIAVAAKKAGWKATTAAKAVSKEKVGDMLGQLSEEDRANLIRQYVPATETGKGKGKGSK